MGVRTVLVDILEIKLDAVPFEIRVSTSHLS